MRNGSSGSLMHGSWEDKTVQPFRKMLWQFFKISTCSDMCPRNCTPGHISQRSAGLCSHECVSQLYPLVAQTCQPPQSPSGGRCHMHRGCNSAEEREPGYTRQPAEPCERESPSQKVTHCVFHSWVITEVTKLW